MRKTNLKFNHCCVTTFLANESANTRSRITTKFSHFKKSNNMMSYLRFHDIPRFFKDRKYRYLALANESARLRASLFHTHGVTIWHFKTRNLPYPDRKPEERNIPEKKTLRENLNRDCFLRKQTLNVPNAFLMLLN